MNRVFKRIHVGSPSTFLWIPVLLLLSGTLAAARELKIWTVDELYQASDAVVVARFVSWNQINWDFGEEPWPRLFAGEVGDYLRKHTIAREAVFRVESVMKGSIASKTVRVLLCDFTAAEKEIENGPRFYPKELAQMKDGPSLMLFLTKSKDEGRYRPTTGHVELSVMRSIIPPIAERPELMGLLTPLAVVS
jgi:hypothetical protein